MPGLALLQLARGEPVPAAVSARPPTSWPASPIGHTRRFLLMAEGDAAAALVALRAAARTWQSLHMPYDAARTAVLVGLACAELGDSAGTEMEFGCAADTFTTLGAGPDLARVNGLRHGRTGGPTTLSDREREVLLHLAAGRTNRQIAARLVVSPHTVARHVEHIYAKLGVTNRAAATTYAYQHHLLCAGWPAAPA
jgi:DNA-binding CsgD family transcriptional regulator